MPHVQLAKNEIVQSIVYMNVVHKVNKHCGLFSYLYTPQYALYCVYCDYDGCTIRVY